LKILYYVTDHGLGHASRAVAVIREIQKSHDITITIRNNDPFSFFKKSLPDSGIIVGSTDLSPVMQKNNFMVIDYKKTEKNIIKWIDTLPAILKKESAIINKEKPDLIITDVSVMPIIAAKQHNIKSVVISNFTWNETLRVDKKLLNFLKSAYSTANLIIKLPLGSPMEFQNKKEFGLMVRKPNIPSRLIREKLGISEEKRIITASLGDMKNKLPVSKDKNIIVFDMSDYSAISHLQKKINFVEGQDIINASDLVLCKCGYGFISECLSSGTKFRYLLEPRHVEANYIHLDLFKIGLQNRIKMSEIQNLTINEELIKKSRSRKIKTANREIAHEIVKLAKG
jgi:hypothetical protein